METNQKKMDERKACSFYIDLNRFQPIACPMDLDGRSVGTASDTKNKIPFLVQEERIRK